MKAVLLDGTTLVAATRLVTRADRPNAVNLAALSTLVESVILHDQVIVLSTTYGDGPLLEAAELWGDGVVVQRHHVPELVDAYVGMEFPDLADLKRLSQEELDEQWSVPRPSMVLELMRFLAGVPETVSPLRRADEHLRTLVSPTPDQELAAYLTELRKTHDAQLAGVKDQARSRVNRFLKRRAPGLHNLTYGWGEMMSELGQMIIGPDQPASDGTVLGTLGADDDAAEAHITFVERYSRLAGTSSWEHRKQARMRELHQFDKSMIVRAHLYIMASEVLGAPYRPDLFRVPVCWKFFRKGSFAEISLEERMVDAAERMTSAQIVSLNDFYGRPAFAALPLFLGRVLRESAKAEDVMAVTQSLRLSDHARRFRAHLASLHEAEEAGEVRQLIGEVTRYGALLKREFGDRQGATEVVWSLVKTASEAAVTGSPASVAKLGVEAGQRAFAAPGLVRSWWYRRKVALIATTLRQARKARALQPETRRLFGAELAQDELELLQRIQDLTSPTAVRARRRRSYGDEHGSFAPTLASSEHAERV